jgi:integrase
MTKKAPRIYGTGSLFKLATGKWLFQYRPKWAPKPLSKTCKAVTQKAASQLLNDWVKELDGQNGPAVEVSILHLIDLHVADMRMNGCDPINIEDVQRRAKKHLGECFKSFDFANPLKKAHIKKYCDMRVQQEAARATINRELAALRRALALGVEDELITVAVPKIKALPENNIRTGVISDEAYHGVMNLLPDHQKMLWCYAFRLGIRKGELLKILAEWLLPYWKEEQPYIKIPGFDNRGNRITKNGKPHTIPLYHPELRAFTEMAVRQRDPKCPYLFQYRGKRLKNIRTGFEKACSDAGYPDLIFHDTRRTAIARMEAAGIPRREAMQISGHRTESVYKRYDIGTEAGATEAGRQLLDYEASRAQSLNKSLNGPPKPEPSLPAPDSDKYLN